MTATDPSGEQSNINFSFNKQHIQWCYLFTPNYNVTHLMNSIKDIATETRDSFSNSLIHYVRGNNSANKTKLEYFKLELFKAYLKKFNAPNENIILNKKVGSMHLEDVYLICQRFDDDELDQTLVQSISGPDLGEHMSSIMQKMESIQIELSTMKRENLKLTTKISELLVKKDDLNTLDDNLSKKGKYLQLKL